MRIFVWAIRLFVFLVFLTLAVRNLQPVTLTLLADLTWETPLFVMLLSTFLLGVVTAGIGLALAWLRQRREILKLSADLYAAQALVQKQATEQHPLLPPSA